jgi:dual specificity MAP kinase phosphatase
VVQESYDVPDGEISMKSVMRLSEKTHCDVRKMEEDSMLTMTSHQLIRKECQKSEAMFSGNPACVVGTLQCTDSAKNADNFSSVHPIVPNELVKLMNNTDKILLLDCRTFMAFNSNHINGALNVGCSDRITRKRLLDGKIGVAEVISGQEAKDVYRSLEVDAEIIVYDESTADLSSLSATSSLKLLLDCLLKRGKQPQFLEGGLQTFEKSFRSLCSQPDPSCNVPLLFSPTSPEVNCDIDSAVASEILPYLFIGNQRDAANRERLSELGITHVMNVTAHLPLCFETDGGIVYKRLPATDSGCQNLKKYFAEAIEFIDEAKHANGRVLVHCQAGVSRSPTIVIAYLMARCRKTLMEAFNFVKDQRHIVAPNINFMGQLLEFEQKAACPAGLHPPLEPLHQLRL